MRRGAGPRSPSTSGVGEMEGASGEEVRLEREALRQIAFPVADELSAAERAEWVRRETVARMLRTTVARLEEEEREDDIRWSWPLPGEAEAVEQKEGDMPTEN